MKRKKIAVLSNVNMDPLRIHLKGTHAPDPYFGAFGQYMVDLLEPGSALRERDLDTLLIHLDGEELLKDALFSLPRVEETERHFHEVLGAVHSFCVERPDVSVIVSLIALPPFNFTSHLEGTARHTFRAVEDAINGALRTLAAEQRNLFLLDFPRLLKWHGYRTIYDDKYWYLGRIKYTKKGFEALADELASLLNAVRDQSKKVLVLDLDNTLWGGIVGEDGPSGIALSEDGTGKAYRDFQKCIKALKSIGIVLALNSKNNEPDALEVFETSPMMILQYSDFVARRVNWGNKVDNLREIASELNVGLDSLVFVDDSPVERALVRQYLPEVGVPEFPADPAMLRRWFLSEVVYHYFPRVRLTTEDRDKSAQYERNLLRKQLGARVNVAEFIASLHIKIRVRKNDRQSAPRIAQLTQKTNQFNLTTRRLTLAEVETYMESKQSAVYGLEYEDRFGSEGVVGACIVECVGDRAHLQNVIVSCRVLGRNVEHKFLNLVLDDLSKTGFLRVSAEYIASPKNGIAKDFYCNSGFMRSEPGHFHNDISAVRDTLQRAIDACRHGGGSVAHGG